MINWANPSVIIALCGVIAFALFVSFPAFDRLQAHAMRAVATLARSSALSLTVIFIFALLVAILPSIIWSPPVPYVHDEFSYLLAGDTFANFRLVNPPHKLAEFFDTIHVIQHPNYASKFPTGQGLALAIGFWLHLPIAGVWLSTACACAAVGWMLRAFVPPRWALIGALLCAIHPLLAWWTQGYWGGSVAMIGGALLIGGAKRVNGRSMGAGLAILANSRPLEGLILAILVAIWMRRALLQTILPAAIILAPTLAFMGYYNYRVTGNALTLPYVLHARQYMVAPLMFGQDEREIHSYSNKALEDFYVRGEPKEYRDQIPFARRLVSVAYKWWTVVLAYFFNPMILAIPFLAVPFLFAWMRRRAMLLIFIALPTIHMLLTPWLRSTYLAPLMSVFFVAVTIGLREISRAFVGRAIVFATIVCAITAHLVWAKDLSTRAHAVAGVERAKLVDQLRAQGGKHLVIVHYGPHHEPGFEFVYNAADIDHSSVVFAHDLGDSKNQQLLDYYRDRTVWDLYYDEPLYQVKRHE